MRILTGGVLRGIFSTETPPLVPSVDTTGIKIDSKVLARVEECKPRYLSTSGFAAFLIERALNHHIDDLPLSPSYSPYPHTSLRVDKGLERKEEGLAESEANSHKGRGKERKGKQPFTFTVPEELDWCKAQLETFWKEAKSGKKTKAAANLLISQLQQIEKAYSRKVVLEQIELATAKSFDNITLANYEKFGLPAKKAEQEQSAPHPAQRVFTAAGGFED